MKPLKSRGKTIFLLHKKKTAPKGGSLTFPEEAFPATAFFLLVLFFLELGEQIFLRAAKIGRRLNLHVEILIARATAP